MPNPNLTPLPIQFKDVAFLGVTGAASTATEKTLTGRYATSVMDSINRILTTRLGERVMRPDFGCDLYLLKDRDFNSEWRIKATRYVYEAIQRHEPRVRFKRLHFNIDATTGQHSFFLELEAND